MNNMTFDFGTTGFGFGAPFIIVPIFVTIGFIFIFGIIIVMTVKGIKEWNNNNHSPKLTVPTTVISKRMDVSSHRSNDSMHSHTYYYVTFQVESGDRMEFHVSGSQYGLMTEGDTGNLSFQGTRFLEFNRTSI